MEVTIRSAMEAMALWFGKTKEKISKDDSKKFIELVTTSRLLFVTVDYVGNQYTAIASPPIREIDEYTYSKVEKPIEILKLFKNKKEIAITDIDTYLYDMIMKRLQNEFERSEE